MLGSQYELSDMQKAQSKELLLKAKESAYVKIFVNTDRISEIYHNQNYYHLPMVNMTLKTRKDMLTLLKGLFESFIASLIMQNS